MSSASERKPFVLRLEPATMNAMKAWAADDLRSLNGQIEYLLRAALREAGRLPSKTRRDRTDTDGEPDGGTHPGTRSQQSSRPTSNREPAASAKGAR